MVDKEERFEIAQELQRTSCDSLGSEPVGCLQLAVAPFLVLLLVLALVAYLPFWAGDRLRAAVRERRGRK